MGTQLQALMIQLRNVFRFSLTKQVEAFNLKETEVASTSFGLIVVCYSYYVCVKNKFKVGLQYAIQEL